MEYYNCMNSKLVCRTNVVVNTVVHLQSKWLVNINEKWDVASVVLVV